MGRGQRKTQRLREVKSVARGSTGSPCEAPGARPDFLRQLDNSSKSPQNVPAFDPVAPRLETGLYHQARASTAQHWAHPGHILRQGEKLEAAFQPQGIG